MGSSGRRPASTSVRSTRGSHRHPRSSTWCHAGVGTQSASRDLLAAERTTAPAMTPCSIGRGLRHTCVRRHRSHRRARWSRAYRRGSQVGRTRRRDEAACPDLVLVAPALRERRAFQLVLSTWTKPGEYQRLLAPRLRPALVPVRRRARAPREPAKSARPTRRQLAHMRAVLLESLRVAPCRSATRPRSTANAPRRTRKCSERQPTRCPG